jgi:hypothetical protein
LLLIWEDLYKFLLTDLSSSPGHKTHEHGAVMALLASQPFTGDQT